MPGGKRLSSVWCAILPLILCTVSTYADSCPSGWTPFQESCYFLDKTHETWMDAKVVCDVLDAYLTEINTDAENTFLANKLSAASVPMAWIGLEDFVTEGTFVWARFQDPPEYTHWEVGEPNNKLQNEDCTHTRDNGLWNDAPCHYQLSFVCEKAQEGGDVIGR